MWCEMECEIYLQLNIQYSYPSSVRTYWNPVPESTLVVVDVNNLKDGRKPVKIQKESPTGYAGEGKQSKGN